MRPTFFYDNACPFCCRCVRRWKKRTGDHVVYQPFQETTNGGPLISPEQREWSVHFVDAQGTVFTGARAIVELFSHGQSLAWHRWVYLHVPLARQVAEFSYKKVSSCRECADKITRVIWRD